MGALLDTVKAVYIEQAPEQQNLKTFTPKFPL
jgi:hypothetical protein